jgi:hypothetical protein
MDKPKRKVGNPNIHKHSKPFTSENQPEGRGRPKGSKSIKTILDNYLEVTKNLKNPLTNELEELSIKDLIGLKMIKEAMDGNLAFIKEIIDRTEGKITNNVILQGDADKPLVISEDFTPEKEKRLLQLMKKAQDLIK